MAIEFYRLIYHSRNLIAGSTEQIGLEIDRILETSRRQNSRNELTGALIFNSGVFAQVLEGRRPDIERTFERIQRDERHSDVEVLALEAVPERSFPSWSMGYLGRSQAQAKLLAHIGASTGFEAKRLDGERVLQIMQEIAIEEETLVA